MFNVIHWLRGGDPAFRGDVVDGRLHAHSIMFREQPQAFPADYDLGPDAFNQHENDQTLTILRSARGPACVPLVPLSRPLSRPRIAFGGYVYTFGVTGRLKPNARVNLVESKT